MEVLALGGALPAGGIVATGFDADYSDATALPAAFLLNGTACTPALSVFGQSTPPATPPPTPATRAPAQNVAPARTDNSGPGNSDDNSGKGKGEGGSGDDNSGKGKGGGDDG
jgi:hypothetical protein